MKNIVKSVVVVSVVLVSGCANDDLQRTEGLTLGAGNAMAANSAMQIIDPWPAGVEDTDLVVPSDRPIRKKPAETGTSTPAPAAPVQ